MDDTAQKKRVEQGKSGERFWHWIVVLSDGTWEELNNDQTLLCVSAAELQALRAGKRPVASEALDVMPLSMRRNSE